MYTWINKEDPHCFRKDVVDRMKALIRDSLHCVQEDRYHSDVIGGDGLWMVAGDWDMSSISRFDCWPCRRQ